MPDYLRFESSLVELEPEEAEPQLRAQLEKLQEAIARLSDSDRVSNDTYHRVVSL